MLKTKSFILPYVGPGFRIAQNKKLVKVGQKVSRNWSSCINRNINNVKSNKKHLVLEKSAETPWKVYLKWPLTKAH